MTIKHKITTTILAATLALTGATASAQYLPDRPGSEGNTSETGITRTPRTGTSQDVHWYEGEWMYLNYRQGDALMVGIVDQGTKRSAEQYQEIVLTDSAMAYAGMEPGKTFRVTGTNDCDGRSGDLDGMRTYIIVCKQDSYTATIIATNRRDAVDVAQEIEEYGEPTAPRGYVED